MACEGHLVEWVSDKLATLLGCSDSESPGVQDVIRLGEECSSMGDLVCRLVEFGFAPRRPADLQRTYTPRSLAGPSVLNYPKQEIAEEHARKQSTYNLLVNEDGTDTDNQSSISGQSLASQPFESWEHSSSSTRKTEDQDSEDYEDDMQSEGHLRAWVSDKLMTLLSYPKSIAVEEIIGIVQRLSLEECSSPSDLVDRLLEYGFTSSAETHRFTIDIHAKLMEQRFSVEEHDNSDTWDLRIVHADDSSLKFHADNVGDHIALLNIYNSWKETDYSTQWCYDNYIQLDSMKRARDIRDQLEGLLKRVEIEICSNASDLDGIKKAITSGFFYHAARLQNNGYVTAKKPRLYISILAQGWRWYVHSSSYSTK
ncbi:hypothetical protein ACP4OV_031010 [Aristida adscensionis]